MQNNAELSIDKFAKKNIENLSNFKNRFNIFDNQVYKISIYLFKLYFFDYFCYIE